MKIGLIGSMRRAGGPCTGGGAHHYTPTAARRRHGASAAASHRHTAMLLEQDTRAREAATPYRATAAGRSPSARDALTTDAGATPDRMPWPSARGGIPRTLESTSIH